VKKKSESFVSLFTVDRLQRINESLGKQVGALKEEKEALREEMKSFFEQNGSGLSGVGLDPEDRCQLCRAKSLRMKKAREKELGLKPTKAEKSRRLQSRKTPRKSHRQQHNHTKDQISTEPDTSATQTPSQSPSSHRTHPDYNISPNLCNEMIKIFNDNQR
jgi:hypothetical protein